MSSQRSATSAAVGPAVGPSSTSVEEESLNPTLKYGEPGLGGGGDCGSLNETDFLPDFPLRMLGFGLTGRRDFEEPDRNEENEESIDFVRCFSCIGEQSGSLSTGLEGDEAERIALGRCE